MQNCRLIFSISKSFESLQNIYMCIYKYVKNNEGNFSLSFYSVRELQANNRMFTNILVAYSSQVMQSTDMGLCMHIDIYISFMRAKFQMAT